MTERELWVERRKETGKGPARRVRREGKIPAIIYGPGREPVPVVVDPKQIIKILQIPTGKNTILTLKSSEPELEGRKVLIRDYQIDPIIDELIHIDLMEVKEDRPVRVQVPIQLLGKPIGVEKGGTLEEHIRQLEIVCLPSQIPEVVKIDVSELDLGDSIHIRDLKLEGIKVLTEGHLAIATMLAPARLEAEAEEGEEVMEEEAEEKEAPKTPETGSEA